VKENPPIRGSAQRRIAAPIGAVWQELAAPEVLMATMPIENIHVDDEHQSGSFTVRIGIGPLSVSKSGSGGLTDVKEPDSVVFELNLDDHSLRSLHTATLTPAGEDETLLDYSVELQPAHPMPRLRRFLNGIFDLHIRDYVDHVSSTASRHWKAEQAMGLHPPKEH
jgi:carbon monoxide dehydrogenase subunit G